MLLQGLHGQRGHFSLAELANCAKGAGGPQSYMRLATPTPQVGFLAGMLPSAGPAGLTPKLPANAAASKPSTHASPTPPIAELSIAADRATHDRRKRWPEMAAAQTPRPERTRRVTMPSERTQDMNEAQDEQHWSAIEQTFPRLLSASAL